MIKLSPSLLAADPLHLGDAVKMTMEAGCDELHFDVMDAHFVPNLTFGPHILKAIDKAYDIVLDVHLMLSDPIRYVDAFADAGADIITVHVEGNDFEQTIHKIKERGLQASASVRPGTPADALRPYVHLLDRVLIMSVEPGFGGQPFQPETLTKARELRAMGFAGEIEIDGGVGPANMKQVVDAGIGVLVMGTAFYKAEDPMQVARLVHAL